jgi:hypothetical protein
MSYLSGDSSELSLDGIGNATPTATRSFQSLGFSADGATLHGLFIAASCSRLRLGEVIIRNDHPINEKY